MKKLTNTDKVTEFSTVTFNFYKSIKQKNTSRVAITITEKGVDVQVAKTL